MWDRGPCGIKACAAVAGVTLVQDYRMSVIVGVNTLAFGMGMLEYAINSHVTDGPIAMALITASIGSPPARRGRSHSAWVLAWMRLGQQPPAAQLAVRHDSSQATVDWYLRLKSQIMTTDNDFTFLRSAACPVT